MSIDWAQVLEKPDRSFKVPGTLLLQQRNKIEKLQKSLDELKAAKTESDQNVSSLTLRIETVLGELETKKGKITEQDEQVDKLKEVLAGLEDNLASNNEERKQLTERITELEGTLTSKEAELSEAANAASQLQELGAKVAEIPELQTQLSEKEAKISELENQIAQAGEGLQKKVELLENEKSSFEEQYKLKEAEIAEKNELTNALQAKVEELEKSLGVYTAPEPAAAPAAAGEVGAKASVIKSQIPWKSGTGVHVCPDCGSNRTEDMKDKSKVLYVAAGTPIYAKKKRCLNCGTEWAVD
ncbi:MAG: hypothetical protein HWN66_06895 [Candidatus Helarchaeota archaeon]|nr:hypothetical protein [Candidatus Helarchaeota archaeon]